MPSLKRYRPFALWLIGWVVGMLAACQSATPTTLSGVVRTPSGPISGAVVRIQTRPLWTTTDAEGRFIFTGLSPDEAVALTAWAPGYYITGGQTFLPGAEEVELVLQPHADTDNPSYLWVSAFARNGEEGHCEHCHASTPDDPAALPFDEWQRDPHAHAAHNPRFLSMYSGTDLAGHQSPPTRYGYIKDYGRFTLPPDPQQPYYGPGYKLDFPHTAGNCAACHTPAAAVAAPYGTDPRQVTDAGAEGVTCDFCHKIWDVKLGPDGLPYPNLPGVLSFVFRRPPPGHQFFAGPLDDVAPGEDTYVPLYRQSQYCAPCHVGDFWNVRVYNSFGEWLTSPYNAPDGKTCQDCHMPPGHSDHFVRLDQGGRRRDPNTIFSHDMTVTPDLLRQAITLQAHLQPQGGSLRLTVRLTNTGAGHHVPTDSPLRQMILVVQAVDAHGEPLPLREGPVLPSWAGVGDPAQGNYAGLPGMIYAKTLQEVWTEITPTGAYWNPTRILGDTRLPALASNTTAYTFSACANPPCRITVRLWYRRAFRELQRQKGWDVPDTLMAEQILTIQP